MYPQQRLDEILALLKANGYLTVKYLTSILHYSSATVNRDLNALEGQKLVKRSYGGVELNEDIAVPLIFRYHKMKAEKLKIGKAAAELVEDGDTIFIDGSTTSEYMAQFLWEKKELTVITNNIALASHLSEKKIDVICLGGRIMEIPSIVASAETVESVKRYRADKSFLSSAYVSSDGKMIGNTDVHVPYARAMIENSDMHCLLSDHEKVDAKKHGYEILSSFDKMDYVISDYHFSLEVQKKYAKTKFVCV